MAQTTEVVQHDIETTRNDLAEKLASLSDKITGTVENVEETVANVTEKASETVEAVKETVSGTVESVRETVEETVESVRDTVSSTVSAIRNAFDLQKQVQERPWLVFGGAVALGFVGGKLIGNFTARSSNRESHTGSQGGGRSEAATYRNVTESAQPQQAPSREATSQESSSGQNWFSSIASTVTEKFGSELSTLKGLALGSLFGVVRDMLTRHLPESIKSDVGNAINKMTETMGGKAIQGPVFGDSEQDGESKQGSSGAERSQSGGQPRQQKQYWGAAEHSHK